MTSDTLAQTTEIENLFPDWAEALRSRDAAKVAALYAPDAVLLPTMSGRIYRTTEDIIEYFQVFLTSGPEGRILDSTVRTMGDVAVHAGIYRFTMTAVAGRPEADARFMFVYQRLGKGWKIVAHHSSFMPAV